MRRHKPPSQVRYEKSHPVISARVDRETYDKLKKLVETEGKTLAGFLKDFAKKKKKRWSKTYNMGYNAGKKDFQVWYYCNVCGEKLTVEPNGAEHGEIIEYLRKEGWGHAKCHEQKE